MGNQKPRGMVIPQPRGMVIPQPHGMVMVERRSKCQHSFKSHTATAATPAGVGSR